MLQLKDIVKDYPTATTTVHALRKVSLNFRESEFVAILGPSGCGKTTMLNIIGGLDRYTDGDLVIGGISTKEFDDEHWDAYRNATIGFVFQSYNLIPHLSVLENVELALSLVGESKKTRRAKAVAALHKVNMHEEINKRPNQLSGGQMQRVAIARAIVNDPKIILADEPTGALDSELSVQVMDILKEISQTRLVIMVTHNAELAYQYATRICRFKDGQLIEDTNPYIPEENLVEESAQSCDDADMVVEQNLTTDVLSDENNDINADIVQNDTNAREKKVSNRKRKKAMKAVDGESKEVLDKLGINSLSKNKKRKDKSFKPTSMSAGMAFGLSIKNLFSKKRRTFFTTFAGSIGIIGLGLVLSISNGFDVYIKKLEKEMFSSVPLGIYQYNVKDSAIMDMMMNLQNQENEDAYPETDSINVTPSSGSGSSSITEMTSYVSKFVSSFLDGITKNDITEEFTEYMKNMPSDNYKSLGVSYGLRYNLVRKTYDENGNQLYTDVSQSPRPITALGIASTVLGENGLQSKYWQELAGDKDTMLESYELIGEKSRYPQNKNEIVLCVGIDNKISEDLLINFGIDTYAKNAYGTVSVSKEDGKAIKMSDVSYEYFLGQKIRLVDNDDYYTRNRSGFYDAINFSESELTWGYDDSEQEKLSAMYENSSTELEIVGVIRQKEKGYSFVSSAICYTPELAEWAVEQAYNSKIASFQRELKNSEGYIAFGRYPNVDNVGFTDDGFSSSLTNIVSSSVLKLDYFNRAIGADKSASYFTVFPETFEQKEAVIEYIGNWKKNNIGYFDVSEMFLTNMSAIVDLVSVLLVAVASISLVVSTVMIGVITSNSVIERIREIGILRAIGARKRDIRHVFIAETALIGLWSGLVGIAITYILCPIISLIIKAITGIGSLLHFHPLHALALVAISLVLTVISGIVPAISASRKNVVDALRVE